MKKICFIMTDAVSFNVLGKGQLEYFSSNNEVELTLICGGEKQNIEHLKSRSLGEIVVMPLLRKPSLFKDAFCLLLLLNFFIKNRFDLVVYSTPKALLLGSIATFFTRQSNRVAIVQGRVYENFYGLKRKIFESFDKLSFNFSHKVIFVSSSLMNKVVDEKIISNNKALILGSGSFNGVDINRFSPKLDEDRIILRSNLRIDENAFVICTVGRICRDKGIKDLENIVNLNISNKILFLVVGVIEDEFSEKIINNLKQKDNFIHLPHTSSIQDIFSISDLHLFLSYREGFGNVALEAASCNIPTFAYNVVGVKDSVQHEITGLRFDFQDIESIAEAIAEAVKNPKTFKERFSKARTWAVENFEQKQVWENYLNFYKKVANGELEHD